MFLSLGLAVNEVDQEGQTALHYGVLGFADRKLTWVKTAQGEKCLREEPEEAIPVVQRLLEEGADPSIRDKHGFTPLDYAKKMKAEAITELLRPEKGSE
ncbi:MAG: hypothetical protein JSR83_21765 [Proteobacteria bacterium]|nr:hypothetical protein [Pseudomonadota bacterium]